MKTKLLLSTLLSFYFYLLSSQIPQGFNYQAIARDGVTGNPITTAIPVRISIQSDEGGTTKFWVEEHSSVTPNNSGLFTLVVGNGVRQSGVTNFSDIDWSVTPKYIKTEIYYQSDWKNMGASQLWTVPYSMVAGNLNGTLKNLTVKSQTDVLDEALFEVKNKGGQTIFAVYNEGVRVYVSDGKKGAKGGFAIGGFGTDKGTVSQKYLYVDPDSIRAYIYNDPLSKGAKGGFAIGGFDNTKTMKNNYMVISPDSARIYVNNRPSTTKGAKGGFAIGGFDESKGLNQKYLTVSVDSIRMYIDDKSKTAKGGFAIGGFETAKGVAPKNFLNVATDAGGIVNPAQNRILWYPLKNAFLSGQIKIQHPDSIGTNSTTTGFESRAKGGYSQAMGYQAIARGEFSTAIGKNAFAGRDNSFAFGDGAQTLNVNAYALGSGARAIGIGSYAFGSADRDTLGNTTGVNTEASGSYSFAIGMGARSTGKNAFSIGTNSISGNTGSMALGFSSSATNVGSTALGYGAYSSGNYSIALNGNAQGLSSIAIGGLATGESSTAIGSTTASGKYSFAAGFLSQATALGSVSIGSGTWALSLFDRTYSSANGIYSYALGRDVIANAAYSYALGNNLYNNSYSSFAFGRYPVMPSGASLTTWVDTDPLFIIGNGYSSTMTHFPYTTTIYNNNAITVLKNGYTGINTDLPTQMLDVRGPVRIMNGGSYDVWLQGGAPTWGDDRNLAMVGFNDASLDKLILNWSSEYFAGTEMHGVFSIYGDEGQGVSSLTPALTVYKNISGNSSAKIVNLSNSNTSDGLYIQAGQTTWSSTGAKFIKFLRFDGTEIGSVRQNSSTTVTYATSSDRRLKENILGTRYSIADLMNIKVQDYNFINDLNKQRMTGFIAQDLYNIFPDAVNKPESQEGPWQVDYGRITPLLVKAIQDQQHQIEVLTEKVKEIDSLKAELEEIKAVLAKSK